jgi:hypothetical protein
MKNVKLMGLVLLLSVLCAFKANAFKGDLNDIDSLLQSFSTSAAPSPYGGGGSSSHFIPVDSANKMLESYLNSINADIDTSGNVQSFIMDADALREYLADNSIKKVKIMLAHTLDYINAGNAGINCGYRSGKLTIIIAGYDADKNYIFAPGNTVLDRASPCPTQCELTGTASDMTLH